MSQGLGIAVIGAGIAGREHAAAYRTASTLYEPALPPLRLTAIADTNPGFGSPDFGSAAASRFRYERYEREDVSLGRVEGIEVAAQVLLDAAAANHQSAAT